VKNAGLLNYSDMYSTALAAIAIAVCQQQGNLYVNYNDMCVFATMTTEAESKEEPGVLGSMPELTITSPYVHSRVDSSTFTLGRVDLNTMSEATLSPSHGLWI
jgi:hypothetical protein